MRWSDRNTDWIPEGIADYGGLHDRYIAGTESALVAAGEVRPEWLPGKPGRNKVHQQVLIHPDGSASFPTGKGSPLAAKVRPGDRSLTITRKSRITFEVRRDWLPAEAWIKDSWHIAHGWIWGERPRLPDGWNRGMDADQADRFRSHFFRQVDLREANFHTSRRCAQAAVWRAMQSASARAETRK